MAELTAVGKYIQFWWPEIPTWVSALVFFVAVNLINTLNVKFFGEAEFWFAIIKVVAIVGMIVLGCYLLFSGAGPQASISNLWSHGGFFPNGGMGLLMSMAFIMFSFGGLELVGITAAEPPTTQSDPEGDQPSGVPHPDFLRRCADRAAVAVPVGSTAANPRRLGRRLQRQPVRADLLADR
jgi:L-asparagine transporter-like permease